KKAQPIVREYCQKLGVAYESTTLIESYRQALQHLREVGEPLRAAR
ncbi:acyl-CoA desaturase, partial [Actinoplanes sp. NPDC051633]